MTVLNSTRLHVCASYVSGGHSAALAAVGAGSIRLHRHVLEGNLLWPLAFKTLLQVSVNIGLVRVYGRSAVRRAIYAGPQFYDDLSEAA